MREPRLASWRLATVGRMRIALINSGLGLLAAAAELRRQSPGVELILAMDPDGMPWGPRTPDDIAQRSLAFTESQTEQGNAREIKRDDA